MKAMGNMDYLDEKMMELQKIKLREEYCTLETGFFVKDEIVKFNRVKFPEIKISVMLPTSFVTMPSDMARMKYTSEFRPNIIHTSLDTSVNFTFTLTAESLAPNQTKSVMNSMQIALQRLNPSILFFDRKQEQIGENTFYWFDYKSYAIDDQLYNIMFGVSICGHFLHCGFNCRFREKDEWKDAAVQVIKSIKTLE